MKLGLRKRESEGRWVSVLFIFLGCVMLSNAVLVAVGQEHYPRWVQVMNAVIVGLLLLTGGLERID